MYREVLVPIGAAITEWLIELPALGPMLPQCSTGARIERLQPAVGRAIEDESPCRDQGAGRDRRCLRHAPDHTLRERIPGAEPAPLRRSRGGLDSRRRASHITDLAAGGARRGPQPRLPLGCELKMDTLIEKMLQAQIRSPQ